MPDSTFGYRPTAADNEQETNYRNRDDAIAKTASRAIDGADAPGIVTEWPEFLGFDQGKMDSRFGRRSVVLTRCGKNVTAESLGRAG